MTDTITTPPIMHRLAGVPVYHGLAPDPDPGAGAGADAVASRPQIVDNRTLQGFDMVVAITQKTLNDQLALLFAQGVLPQEWHASYNPGKPDNPPRIDVTWDAPRVNLVTGAAASRIVEAQFPMRSGTLTYLEPDPNDPFTNVPRTVPCDGWILQFEVNLGLKDIEASASVVPPEVKKQLEQFETDMFKIEHLFLNFEDANLITNSWKLIAPQGAPDGPAFQSQFAVLLRHLLGLYQGSSNPYILGYSVTQTQGVRPLAFGWQRPEGAEPSPEDPADSPDFAPTGVNYSVFPEKENPALSTLNFLLMTNNLPVPGGGAGLFEHNWVGDAAHQGEMVFSQFLMLGNVITPLARQIGAQPSDLSRDLLLRAGNDKGGETTCQISFGEGTPEMRLDFRYTFDVPVEDRLGTGIGTVTGAVTWRTVLSYALNEQGTLVVTSRNQGYEETYQRHPNWIGKLEEFLAVFADVALAAFTGGKTLFQDLVSGDWGKALDLRIDTAASDIRSRIILPAGKVFFFKDPRFTAQGDLLLAVTYRD